MVLHLPLLIPELFIIGQHLPFTTTADTKMFAKRIRPQAGIFMEMDHPSLGPVLFALG
jgi:hypothetical protein